MCARAAGARRARARAPCAMMSMEAQPPSATDGGDPVEAAGSDAQEGSPRRPLPAVASLEYQRAKLAEESQAAAASTESQLARVEALRALQAGESNDGTSANVVQLEHDEEENCHDTVVIVPGESYLVLTTCRVRVGVELNSKPVGHISAGEVIGKRPTTCSPILISRWSNCVLLKCSSWCIVALETRATDTGAARVRVEHGWLSTRSSDGIQLLGLVGDDRSDDEESEEEESGEEHHEHDRRSSSLIAGTEQPIRRLLRRISPQSRSRARPTSSRGSSSSESSSSASSGEESADDDGDAAVTIADPEELARSGRRSLHAWLSSLKPTARWKSGVEGIFARFEDEEVEWTDLINPDFDLDHDALLRMGVRKEGHRGAILVGRKRLLMKQAATSQLEPQIVSFYERR